MDEVGRAVDGVDDEGRGVGDLGLARDVRLLADEEVRGVEGLQAGGDVLLDGLVCLGYDVDGWMMAGMRQFKSLSKEGVYVVG